jgi:hypothetical protein
MHATHNVTLYMQLSGYLVFNFMHSWYEGMLHFPIPRVSIYTMLICINDAHDFFI